MLWFIPLLKDLFVALIGAAGYKSIDIAIKKKKERDLRIEQQKNLKEEILVTETDIRENENLLHYYSFNTPILPEDENKIKKFEELKEKENKVENKVELKVELKEENKVEKIKENKEIKTFKERRLSVTIPQDQDMLRSPLASTRLKQLL